MPIGRKETVRTVSRDGNRVDRRMKAVARGISDLAAGRKNCVVYRVNLGNVLQQPEVGEIWLVREQDNPVSAHPIKFPQAGAPVTPVMQRQDGETRSN